MKPAQQVTIIVKGIVQGVGFRPFVFRLAHQLNLVGSVLNNHLGVTILLQGRSEIIEQFIETLTHSPPPLARIDAIELTHQPQLSIFHRFSIIDSHISAGEHAKVAISADKSICQDCLDDINDPHNRHYQYPFTNCTNCGPRYTIINALPYDRCNTAMADFVMCDNCRDAYTDPLNRRYHAQPVSCPHCGPQLSFSAINASDEFLYDSSMLMPLEQAVEMINRGGIVAIKGLGGFHLVCDATNNNAVMALRQRKQRPAKPLAIMVRNLAQAQLCVSGTEAEWLVLTSPEKPITLMQKRQHSDIELSPLLAPGIDRLGVFLPYTPLHHLLMQRLNKPIVATSANRSGEPIIGNIAEIEQHLGHVVNGILDHNRPIINACDDSVVQVIDEQVQVIRLARGYAPLTINLHSPMLSDSQNSVLAVGAQQKNTVAFGFADNLIVSPHIGDLFSLEAQHYFTQSLATFKRLYDFNPSHIVHDNHPQYSPTQWAINYQSEHNLPQSHCIGIQHHFAHVLSVMAMHQRTDQVLGFSFDGTGLGDDGVLWGSEVMLADVNGFTTVAHFSSFKLIGGEQAIKHPVRILLALLFEQMTLQQVLALPIAAIQNLGKKTVTNLYQLWHNNSHCIECRSVGRLFDALAVALDFIGSSQYEGQAGMMIETAANDYSNHPKRQPLSIRLNTVSHNEPEPIQWHSSDFITQLVNLVINHSQTPYIKQQVCWHFIDAISQQLDHIGQQYPQLPQVFCGGVFQNKTLLSQCIDDCRRGERQFLPSGHIPINDGGIALGQLWYAIHHMA
ncbi:MAG: carbamoyltransferase HypF [Shewanella psychromarinicola]|uniref:carbamoyltransferase HypF n=1 Tax=Shewanella TaxID=22 RepID=UPI000C331733|nr:carbamoyltransferase HypF [Shewanella sp. Actino-trap-3]PKG77437.1 carbamoyltransferase HypF [Shewanella sp. Actino-trap-3]|tara:strand:- start:218225 stop:220591 length:2367 start_codon:yes stop_codon:yes gene_type:complete